MVKSVKRISITIPTEIHKKMIEHINTWPLETRNVSKYISNLINTNTPELEQDID